MRKGSSYTVSHGTGHHLFAQGPSEFEPKPHQLLSQLQQPPLPPPKKRNSTTLTLRHTNSHGIGNGSTAAATATVGPSTLANPKRVSVATSSFWDGHPDMGHLIRGWELGLTENNRPGDRSSLWGCTFDPKLPQRPGLGLGLGLGPKLQHTHTHTASTATLDGGGGGSSTLGTTTDTDSLNIWGDPPAVKKGILLAQRDKLLSRWKERYCILTRDYLHCFRRTSSIHRSSGIRLSEMGNFIFKLRLAEIDEIEWETKRSCSMLVILLPREPKIHLRVLGDNVELLRQWFTLLQECVYTSKERRAALRTMYSTNTSTTIGSGSMSLSDGSSPSTATNTSGSQSTATSTSTSTSTSSSSGSSESTDKVQQMQKQAKDSMPKEDPVQINNFKHKFQVNSNTLDKTDSKKKYSQLLEDDDDDFEDEDEIVPVEKVVLRRDLKKNAVTGSTRTRTVEDFMEDQDQDQDQQSSSLSSNSENSGSPPPQIQARSRKTTIHVGSGYSIPIDFTNMGPPKPATNRRPESWAPAPSHHNESLTTMPQPPIPAPRGVPRNQNSSTLTYRTPTLIPNQHWLSTSRSNIISNNTHNHHYQRVSVQNPSLHQRTFNNNCGLNAQAVTTPSIHTSEITFRKMC